MKMRIILWVSLGADTLDGLGEEVNRAIEEQGLEPVGDPVFENGMYHQDLVERKPGDASEERLDRSAPILDGTVKLVETHTEAPRPDVSPKSRLPMVQVGDRWPTR